MKHPAAWVIRSIVLGLTLALFVPASPAQTEPGPVGASGQVELPLEIYHRLVEASQTGRTRSAPAGFALGSAQVTVSVDDVASGAVNSTISSAKVRVDVALTIEVLEGDWVLIPLLPAGVAIEDAKVDDKPVQLIASPRGLAWAARQPGTHTLQLSYRLQAARSSAGVSVAIPLPRAAVIDLVATLPGTGLDAAVIPSAGATFEENDGVTRLRTSVPATEGVQLSWRLPTAGGHVLSRARYSGQLVDEAVVWSGELAVELLDEEAVTLQLLPSSVTLRNLRIDGRDAAILLEKECFATLVRGRGRHTVTVDFEVPVERQDGPPRIELAVPKVPISSFELALPGDKEVTVNPASSVVLRRRGEQTLATAHVPLTSKVSMAWTEAVPEEERKEVRADAAIYHAAYAEEGVLQVRALIDVELRRGETHRLRFEVPAEVQIDRVVASDAVADWRLGALREEDDSRPGGRELTVFFDRQLEGQQAVEIVYDRALDAAAESELQVPLLRSLDAQRQRGMVALLESQNRVLEPVAEEGGSNGATRVGENQLPAVVRESLGRPVAHTYKYAETRPVLTVRAAMPERGQDRVDALVDTLISVGDVGLKASTTLEIDVQSGRLMELELTLPIDVDLLSLTGPSVRQHRIETVDDEQQIRVEFSQEMTGRFRLEAAYERRFVGPLAGRSGESKAPEVEVPLFRVSGVDVEQGRVAVEALAAVEVQPVVAGRLTALEASEIPQRLVLRTSHPILYAFRYIGASSSRSNQAEPRRLALTVTRHQTVDVHQAVIDRAEVRTLFTRDGLSVTAARFQVRNHRRQFLRLRLPKDSQIWSAFVDGRSEKPARALGEDGEPWHLIRIPHATEGFPVELVFQTPSKAIHGLGTISGVLPRPEILVTHTRWDVFLPQGVSYGQPSREMEQVNPRRPMTAEEVSAQLVFDAGDRRSESGHTQVASMQPLRPLIPSSGLHFAFEKLYANQGGHDVGFSIPYASGRGRDLGRVLSLTGASAFWIGLALAARGRRRLGVALATAGAVLLAIVIGRYQLGAGEALWLSALLLAGVTFVYGKAIWARRRATVG